MATPKVLNIRTEEQVEQLSLNFAQQCDDVIERYSRATRYSWIDLGKAAAAIKDKELWKQLKPVKVGDEEPAAYHSFEDYIQRKTDSGRSTIYRAISLVTEFNAIKEQELREIPLVNAIWLLKLKKRGGRSKWCNPKWIEQAQRLSEKDFANLVNSVLPGAAKEEEQQLFSIPRSLADRFEEVMKVAKWAYETPDDAEALEAMFQTFMNSPARVILDDENFAESVSIEDAFHRKFNRKKTKK
jgi:hypothetical protein